MGALTKSFQKLLSLPEWILLKEAKLGDKEAFGKLYQLYMEKLYRFVFFRVGQKKEVAEDIVSEVFMKAWEKLDQFKEGSFQAWLYMITRNKVVDYYRSSVPQSELTEQIEGSHNVEEKVLQTLEIERIKQAITKLTPEQQELIILKFIEDMDNQEIGQILEKKEDAIRSMQYRAIKELRVILLAEKHE